MIKVLIEGGTEIKVFQLYETTPKQFWKITPGQKIGHQDPK